MNLSNGLVRVTEMPFKLSNSFFLTMSGSFHNVEFTARHRREVESKSPYLRMDMHVSLQINAQHSNENITGKCLHVARYGNI